MVQAMVAAALEGAANRANDLLLTYPLKKREHIKERIRALIPAPASVALEAALAQREREVWEKAAKVLEAMPRRIEPLGGQRTSYVQLGEATVALRAKAAEGEG